MDDKNANVSQALDKLLRLKKVERIGLGRSARYRRLWRIMNSDLTFITNEKN